MTEAKSKRVWYVVSDDEFAEEPDPQIHAKALRLGASGLDIDDASSDAREDLGLFVAETYYHATFPVWQPDTYKYFRIYSRSEDGQFKKLATYGFLTTVKVEICIK